MTHVALYLRISKDRDGTHAAVERQEHECRQLIARDGCTAHVVPYTDNDITAKWQAGKKKKRRPEYERMLCDISAGQVSAIYAWKSDRIIREPRELEGFMDACGLDAHSEAVPVHTVMSGSDDFSTANGRMIARIKGAVAANEVEQSRERIHSKMNQRRRKGAYHKATAKKGAKPSTHFVYRQNGDGTLAVNSDAADQYRSEVKRLLAGGPEARLLATFARERHERGLWSSRGTHWSKTSLRFSLLSSTPAAVTETSERLSTGAPDWAERRKVADGDWPAVVSYQTVLAVRRVLLDPARLTRKREDGKPGGALGREPAHLLTGLLECGKCGHRAFAWLSGATVRNRPDMYGCQSKRVRPGDPKAGYCVSHRAGVLDTEITKLALWLYSHPEYRRVFTKPADDVDVEALKAELRTLNDTLAEAVEAHQAQRTPRRVYELESSRLSAKIDALEARISEAVQRDARDETTGRFLEDMKGEDSPEHVWERLTVREQRSLTRLLIDHVTILPRTPHGYSTPPGVKWPFQPERVQVYLTGEGWSRFPWEDIPPEVRDIVFRGFASYRHLDRDGNRLADVARPLRQWQGPTPGQVLEAAAIVHPVLARRIAPPREGDA